MLQYRIAAVALGLFGGQLQRNFLYPLHQFLFIRELLLRQLLLRLLWLHALIWEERSLAYDLLFMSLALAPRVVVGAADFKLVCFVLTRVEGWQHVEHSAWSIMF